LGYWNVNAKIKGLAAPKIYFYIREEGATSVCKFHCSTGPALLISGILEIEQTLSFAGAFTLCRRKLKVSMKQVHGVRNVCAK